MKTRMTVAMIVGAFVIAAMAPSVAWSKGSHSSGSRSSGHSTHAKSPGPTTSRSSSHSSTTTQKHSSKSTSPGPGTGSKSQSTNVKGYVKKDGTYVAPHKRSAPDKNFNNNWSTKGNSNPYTGKPGSQRSPPVKNGG
jgi:hypothetical protein